MVTTRTWAEEQAEEIRRLDELLAAQRATRPARKRTTRTPAARPPVPAEPARVLFVAPAEANAPAAPVAEMNDEDDDHEEMEAQKREFRGILARARTFLDSDRDLSCPEAPRNTPGVCSLRGEIRKKIGAAFIRPEAVRATDLSAEETRTLAELRDLGIAREQQGVLAGGAWVFGAPQDPNAKLLQMSRRKAKAPSWEGRDPLLEVMRANYSLAGGSAVSRSEVFATPQNLQMLLSGPEIADLEARGVLETFRGTRKLYEITLPRDPAFLRRALATGWHESLARYQMIRAAGVDLPHCLRGFYHGAAPPPRGPDWLLGQRSPYPGADPDPMRCSVAIEPVVEYLRSPENLGLVHPQDTQALENVLPSYGTPGPGRINRPWRPGPGDARTYDHYIDESVAYDVAAQLHPVVPEGASPEEVLTANVDYLLTHLREHPGEQPVFLAERVAGPHSLFEHALARKVGLEPAGEIVLPALSGVEAQARSFLDHDNPLRGLAGEAGRSRRAITKAIVRARPEALAQFYADAQALVLGSDDQRAAVQTLREVGSVELPGGGTLLL